MARKKEKNLENNLSNESLHDAQIPDENYKQDGFADSLANEKGHGAYKKNSLYKNLLTQLNLLKNEEGNEEKNNLGAEGGSELHNQYKTQDACAVQSEIIPSDSSIEERLNENLPANFNNLTGIIERKKFGTTALDGSKSGFLNQWLKEEKWTRLQCNMEVLKVKEIVLNLINYVIGRNVVVPSVKEAAERRKSRIETIDSSLESSLTDLDNCSALLSRYWSDVVWKVNSHHAKYVIAVNDRNSYKDNLIVLKDKALSSEKYSDNYANALINWFNADHKYYLSTRDAIFHGNSKRLREAELYILKSTGDAVQAIGCYVTNLKSYSELLAEHLGVIGECYEFIHKAAENSSGAEKEIKRAGEFILKYNYLIDDLKKYNYEKLLNSLGIEHPKQAGVKKQMEYVNNGGAGGV